MATVVGEPSGTTSAGYNPVGVAQPVSGPPVCVQSVAASACVESNLDFESPRQTSGRRTAPVKFVFAQVTVLAPTQVDSAPQRGERHPT